MSYHILYTGLGRVFQMINSVVFSHMTTPGVILVFNV